MEECYEPRTSSQSTISPSSIENDENVGEEEVDDTTRTPPPSLTMTTTIPTCCSATSDTAATLEPHTPIASLPAAQPSSSQDDDAAAATKNSNDFKLAIAFVSMVLVATGVSVMGKLVTQIPKRTFAMFGFLDTLSISIQTFSACYLSGPLWIMLRQAAIPFSLIFSYQIKGERYHIIQYVGAVVVVLGIGIVLGPILLLFSQDSNHAAAAESMYCQTNEQIFAPDEYCTICRVEMTQESCLSHTITTTNTTNGRNTTELVCEWIAPHDPNTTTTTADHATATATTEERTTILWSLVVILSCIPMTLSSLYKEMTLDIVNKGELDPIYLNGWTAFFQMGYSLLVAIPSGMYLFSPTVYPTELPQHLQNAWNCYYYGRGTIDTGCHPDDSCPSAFWLFNINFILVCLLTILSVYILKYGSTSLLFLAFTIQVPLGNLVFSCLIPAFLPGYTPLHGSDIIGLIIIVTGLVLYRSKNNNNNNAMDTSQPDGDLTIPAAATTTTATTTNNSGMMDENWMDSSLQEPLLGFQSS